MLFDCWNLEWKERSFHHLKKRHRSINCGTWIWGEATSTCTHYSLQVNKKSFFGSVSTRLRYCGNPTKWNWRRPPKQKGPIWPFLFTSLQAWHRRSILKAIPVLEIVTNMVANETDISSSVTKISRLVALVSTTFLCVDDQYKCNSYFVTNHALLENYIERSLLLKHSM